jgi:hypothetical protein
MEKDQLTISRTTRQKVVEVASQAGLSPDKMTEVILNGFLDGDGKIFIGKWIEGPGIRLLVDWPRFSATVVKIKEEDLL